MFDIYILVATLYEGWPSKKVVIALNSAVLYGLYLLYVYECSSCMFTCLSEVASDPNR